MANRMSSAEAYARLVKDEREAYAFVEKEYGSTEPMSARQQLNALNLLGKDYNRIVAAGSWRDRDTMRDLRTRVLTAQGRTNDLREYYERNQYRMNSTDYLRAMGELDQLDSMISQMSAGVNAASDMYAPYNNADEYKVNLGYATKYYGMSGADVDTEIERLTNTGRTSRRATDEEVGEIAADLDKRWRQAESNVRDIEGMMQGRLSDEMRQYYNADTLAAAQRELDAIENERESFYTTLADKGGWMIDEVNSENQQAIDWLNDYRGVADYAYGTRRYGYDPAAMKPYEVLDITAKSDEEQAWLDDYVQMAATNGGYIGTEDWRQAAEAQRAYDSIGGTNREAILDLADSYYGWQQLVGTEAAQAQEQRFWRKAEEVAQATGMTPQELLTQVESIYPYVAQMGMEKFRAQVQAEASAHPWITTGLTYVIQPVANLQSSAYLLGSEIFGGTPSAANPAMTAYTYNTATRGQVGADINKYFVGKYGEERGGRYGDTAEWVYNAVNSTVDSAVNMLITNGVLSAAGGALNETGRWVMQNTVSNLVMGSGAASQRFIELKQQGYDDFAAVAGAAGSGLIEGLTEAIGGERLLKAMQTYGVGFLEVLKQGLSEGIEERFANELNGLVDWLYQDDGGESIIRKIVGLVAGYKAAGYDTDEAMRIAFSEATRENWSAFLAGMFSGGLHMAAGGIGQSISRTAGEYSYARAARNSTQELSSINALSQQLNETDKLNLPQLAKSDNIFKVMRTVRSAAEQSNYNATKEATREMGIEVRRQVGENNETVSNELVSAITKRTVSDAITAVRQLSKEEARLLSLTANEEKLLNSRKVRKFIEQLDAKSAEDKKDNEDGLSYSQRNRIKALEFMRANGYEGQLDNIKAADTAKALELVTKAQRVGSTFNGAKPALDTILKETPAAYQGIVTRAFNSGAESQQTAVVNDAGNIELKGVSAAGLAFINQQHRNILDEDSRAEFHENVAGAYFAGQYYGETQYAKQLMEEMYKEHGDIKAELKAVYEASVAERNEKGETARPTTMKRGEVRNISAEEAAANGVSTVDVSKLTQQQKEEAKVVRSLAKQMGFSVVFFDSAGGAVEGWHQGGTIYLDANAGYVNDRSMLRTMSHELTHFIQQYNRSAYNELRDFIVETYHESREEFENRLEQLMASQGISEERALDELIARGCEMMLKDSKAPQLLYERNADLYGKLAARIREWAQAIRNAIRKLMGNVKPHSAEAKRLMAVEAFANEVQQLWDEGLVGAVENMQSGLTVQETEVLAEAGIGIDEETQAAYSLRFSTAYEAVTVGKKDFDTKTIAELISRATGRSVEDAQRWLNSEMTIANAIMQNPEFLDFEADDRYEAIKKNSDYPQGTVDLSNLCPKREEFTAMFDLLQKRYPNKLFTAQDVADMRKILSDADLTVACGACFVEDRRQLVGEIADTYINMWKEAVETGKPLKKVNAAGSKIDLTVTKALAKKYGATAGAKIMATDTYIPTQYDLTTYEGFKLLEKDHPTIALGFVRYNNSRGQQAARLIEGRAEYKRQILGWSAKKVQAVNNNGGLRIFSFSDFEVVHLLDLVQVIIDCSAKGVKIQGYTKIPAFARLVRNTGIKLNRSLIPQGDLGYHMEGGKVVLDYDNKEGININDPNFLDERDNPNVGNIVIGINRTQIEAAMLDEFVDYIIPFHSNKSKEVLRKLGTGAWVNYKEEQHEKDIDTGKASKRNVNIYTEVINKYKPTNKVEFVEAFLKECKRQGKIPRYSEFLNKDESGDYVYREGYYKLLVDFKMFDSDGNILPQGEIVPELDSEFMTEMLSNEVQRKQDYAFPQAVYDKIDAQFGERQYSKREKSPADSEAVQYEVRDDFVGFYEYDISTAVYGIRNEKAERGRDLVKIGTMPKLYRDLFGLSGDVFVSNAHMYQNLVSKDVAINEGRHESGADYHDIGEPKIIAAIEDFQDPIVIMESLNDFKEPRLVAILNEKDDNGQNLLAVFELYTEAIAYKVDRSRNHVLMTIYKKDALPDYIEKTVKANRVLYIKKGVSRDTLASLQLAGNISRVTLDKNLSRFNKKVKIFKQNNNIQYSIRDEADMVAAEAVAEEAANASNREILVNALEAAAQTDLEKQKLADYRKKIAQIDEQEQKLARLRSELENAQGDDAKRLREEIKRTENRINTYDGQLLRLEAAAPLQNVLNREKAALNAKLEEAKAWRKEWRGREAAARAEGVQRLRDYRQKRNESDAVKKYRSRVESSIKSLLDLMVTNTDKKHIPEALKEPIANFIEALDLTSERMREGGKPTKRDIDYNQRLNALRAAMATYTANAAKGEADGYLDLPDGFVEMLNTSFDTPVYDMSAAELRLLDRALTILKTAVSQSNELMVNKNYARVSEAGEATIADLDELGAAKDLGWLKGINKLFLWNNATPYYAFRRLGSAGAAMFESLQSGWDKLALNAQRVVKDSEQMYTAQEAREWGETVLDIELSNERVVKMTAAQAMSVYCLAKRQQGLGHLLGGGIKISVIDAGKGKQIAQYDNYTLTIEDLQAITAVLSERQRQVADKIQDYMGTVGAEWGNEVSMKRFGYRAFGEANYFPITSDPNNLNSLNTDAKSSDMFRLLNLSATKSLVKGANNAVVISNVFDVFAAHMADMAKYNALALPILDMVKWYNYKRREEVKSASGKKSETTHIVTATIQKSLEKAFGVDQGGKSYAAEYIKQFIKDLNGVSEAGRDMGFISTFMGRYKKAAVAANLRVVVQQPMSYARALAVMDAKYLAAGAKGNLGEAVREMQQYSGIAAWKAMGFFDANIGRDLTAQIKHDETLADRLSDASMFLAGKADELTWGTLWKACKAETADKGYTGNELLEKTAERFREVVYSTQVVDATTTRSHLMRSNSPINKMWTAFMSEPTLTYNMMLDTVLQWHFEKRKGNKPKWRDAVGKNIRKAGEAYVVNAVLLAMATALLDAWRDDDDFETFWDKYKEALGGNILDELNPVTKVVVLKDMWDILVEGGGSDRMDTAFLTQTKKACDVVTEWYKVKFKGADPTSTTYYGKMGGYGVIYEVLKALGGITGMPFAATSREVVSLWNNTVGGLYPNLKAKTYNEKPELGYEKLYEAMVAGDQDLQRQLIDQLHGRGLDDEKIDDGVKAVIKDMFLSGELTEEETADQLIAYCGYDATGTGSNSINYQLDRWSIEDFKMSADMDAAFAAGDGEAAREAVEYMMERYGRTESQIRRDITKYFMDAYINGSADERRRIRSLMLATGLYKADALDKQLAGWLKDKDK